MDIEKLKQKKSIKELLEFGIVNIDKPSGMTSFDVSNFVKKILKLRKTSHFGTLDPKVTGVLPIALNRACKLTGFFLKQDKEYKGIMRFHKDISLEDVKKTIKKKFIGKIIQKPPVKSRVKRQERQREIKKFLVLKKEGRDISFETEVESGTYIRKLVHDLGREIGIGAHMIKLRRIRAGIFKEKNSVKLGEFEKAVEQYKGGNEKALRHIIIPAEVIFQVYPVVQIKENENLLRKILTGKPIHKKDLAEECNFETGKIVCVFSGDRFIEMAKVVNNDIFAKPEFVLQSLKN